MKIYYTDHFVLPLPSGHRFPMAKYSMLRERLVQSDLARSHTLVSPRAATEAELLRVHDGRYVGEVMNGGLEPAAVRRIGFPWSPQLVERSRRSVGATLGAAYSALGDGASVNLAGGTHHAFADRGEGFCVFNDVAVAVRALQAEGRVHKVAIIDTDVHQGNGTARIFERETDVFTFSVHGESNFPFRKEQSDLDIALPDRADDAQFLDAVGAGVDAAFSGGPPDVVFHVAGADSYAGDLLGRLSVSKEALAERDRIVLGACARSRVPVVVVMGGGYAARIEDTVDIHYHSVVAAAALPERGTPEPTSL